MIIFLLFSMSIFFLIISKFQFLYIDKLPIISEMPIYRLSISFYRYIVHPWGLGSSAPTNRSFHVTKNRWFLHSGQYLSSIKVLWLDIRMRTNANLLIWDTNCVSLFQLWLHWIFFRTRFFEAAGLLRIDGDEEMKCIGRAKAPTKMKRRPMQKVLVIKLSGEYLSI